VRDSARRVQCQNHLHQLGLALHNYHDAHLCLPPGCVWSSNDPALNQGWGWGAMLLPHLDQQALHQSLGVTRMTLGEALASPSQQPLFRTPLAVFVCPADSTREVVHDYRLYNGFVPTPTTSFGAGPLVPQRHIVPGGGGAGVFGIPSSVASYVGSFGDTWQPDCMVSSVDDLYGDGSFGSNARISFSSFVDGTSQTFLLGERTWKNYAATWTGLDYWNGFDTLGLSMAMGTAFYRINIDPEPYNLSCDGRGAAGFSSRHAGGSQFAMVDGSVRFISEHISSEVTANPARRGIFQKLAARNDGQVVGEY
jgi:prepilin-type processing-associated H-X9-DG protein